MYPSQTAPIFSIVHLFSTLLLFFFTRHHSPPHHGYGYSSPRFHLHIHHHPRLPTASRLHQPITLWESMP